MEDYATMDMHKEEVEVTPPQPARDSPSSRTAEAIRPTSSPPLILLLILTRRAACESAKQGGSKHHASGGSLLAQGTVGATPRACASRF